MTATEPALLAAIVANPDDDTARLVYADWCDENQQPERAEFIRSQIGSIRMSVRSVRRQAALLAQHAAAWLRGPKCERCKPGTITYPGTRWEGYAGIDNIAHSGKCPDCHGRGYTGSLAGRTADVTWRRGFPWRVRSRRDECMADQTLDFLLGTEPSPWLAQLVNEWPVEEVPWVDAEPFKMAENCWCWYRNSSRPLPRNHPQSDLVDAIFDAIDLPYGGHSDIKVATTREAAVADLARAVVLWARAARAVTGSVL